MGPVSETQCHAEPAELVSNHAVIEAMVMKKALGYIVVWEANPDHIKCITKKFRTICIEPSPGAECVGSAQLQRIEFFGGLIDIVTLSPIYRRFLWPPGRWNIVDISTIYRRYMSYM